MQASEAISLVGSGCSNILRFQVSQPALDRHYLMRPRSWKRTDVAPTTSIAICNQFFSYDFIT